MLGGIYRTSIFRFCRRVSPFIRHQTLCSTHRSHSSEGQSTCTSHSKSTSDVRKATGLGSDCTPSDSESCGKNSLSLSSLEMLFELIRPYVTTAPCVTRLATLYARLPLTLNISDSEHLMRSGGGNDTRRWLRNNFGSLSHALHRLQRTNATFHWGIYISQCGVYAVLASGPNEAAEAFASNPFTSEIVSDVSSSRLKPTMQRHNTRNEAETENLLEIFSPLFPGFQPPLPPSQPVPRAHRSIRKETHVGAFTPQMLVPFVPSYFIPMNTLIESLPSGYTAAHVEKLFAATGTLEIVNLGGDQFVRMHGGKRLVDFAAGGEEAHTRWCQFAPNPFLCEPLRRHLPPAPRWGSLRGVIESVSSSIRQALLPWENYQTILFFAQMQHVFGFAPGGEGEVSWQAPVTNLTQQNSPTPLVVAEMVNVLRGQRLYMADLQDPSKEYISALAKTLIMMYYGTLRDFFEIHGAVFYMEDDGALVGLIWDKDIAAKTALPLEEKLEDALVKGDRRTAQKIRRRMALEKNPDNPYADRTVLLDTILRYVPPRRSISLQFLLKSLPPSISDFLPDKPIALFQNAPDKVYIFEYRYRHRIHLIRPGVPLPSGVLRKSYTEEELLFLCAAELGEKPRTNSDLFGRLPYGAKEVIRQKYKNLLGLLRQYPQYFTIVFKDAVIMDSRTAIVTLVQQPPPVHLNEEDYGALSTIGPEEQQLLDKEDVEALQTLSPEMRETLRQIPSSD